MNDPTEAIRRVLVPIVNATTDEELPKQTWDTAQLQEDFAVVAFAAPYVVVNRKSDGQRGTLTFRHNPRVYFDFQAT